MKTYKWVHCVYDYSTMRQGGRKLGSGEVKAKSAAQAKRLVLALVGGSSWRSWTRTAGGYRVFDGDARTSTPYWDLVPATEMVVISVSVE